MTLFDMMAVLAEGLDDKIDVYHAGKFTGVSFPVVSDVEKRFQDGEDPGMMCQEVAGIVGSIGGCTGVLFTRVGGVGSLKLRVSVDLMRRQWAWERQFEIAGGVGVARRCWAARWCWAARCGLAAKTTPQRKVELTPWEQAERGLETLEAIPAGRGRGRTIRGRWMGFGRCTTRRRGMCTLPIA